MLVKYNFVANDLTSSAPVAGQPPITQEHVLGADNVLAGVIVLDGLVRFVWEEQAITAETWTDQTTGSEIWTDQTVSAETWTEAA